MAAKPADQKRDSYIDFLKGIAMIMVVVGHSVSGVRRADVLFNFIYSFHMPLLFFCSAYIEELYRVKYAGNERNMLIKRIRGLLLPYLSWTVVRALLAGRLLEMGVEGTLSELLGYRENGLWFLPVLLGLKAMHTLFWIVRRRMSRNTIFVNIMLCFGCEILLALVAVLTRQPYIINMLSYAIPYFFAVMVVSCGEVKKVLRSEWMAAGVLLIYVVLFPGFSFYNTSWMTQVFRIGMSLCVIIVCLKGTQYWRGGLIYDVVCICGRNSLAIYILHGFMLDYRVYLNMIDSALLIGIISVALAFLVAIICIVIAKCIEISSWWKRILFGK